MNTPKKGDRFIYSEYREGMYYPTPGQEVRYDSPSYMQSSDGAFFEWENADGSKPYDSPSFLYWDWVKPIQ